MGDKKYKIGLQKPMAKLIVQVTAIIAIFGVAECEKRVDHCARLTGPNSAHDNGCNFHETPFCTKKNIPTSNPQRLSDYCYGCDYYNQHPRRANDDGNEFCVERLARSNVQKLPALRDREDNLASCLPPSKNQGRCAYRIRQVRCTGFTYGAQNGRARQGIPGPELKVNVGNLELKWHINPQDRHLRAPASLKITDTNSGRVLLEHADSRTRLGEYREYFESCRDYISYAPNNRRHGQVDRWIIGSNPNSFFNGENHVANVPVHIFY